MSWFKRIVSGLALTGLSLSLLTSGEAEAVSFAFEKIVDTNTLIPGSTGNFVTFGNPSLDNGNVAFGGYSGDFSFFGPPEQGGIYTNIGGGLNVVADTNTPVPGGTSNFDLLGSPSLDNGNVAFTSYGVVPSDPFDPPEQGGIYTDIGGGLNVVADLNTPIPGDTGTFIDFSLPSLDNGDVAFAGGIIEPFEGSLVQGGIYTNIGGALNVVADGNTSIPGDTGTFRSCCTGLYFSSPSLDDGSVAFAGGGNSIGIGLLTYNGIYTNIGGALNVVADGNTSIPGDTGTFDLFGSPSLDDGNVAFSGYVVTVNELSTEYEKFGIYTNTGDALNVVADLNTPIPNGTGTFNSFSDPSLDNGSVAFFGEGSGQEGIYATIGGALAEVIAEGDLLDGKRVSGVGFGREGLSGNQIAFGASFTDGSEGIYVATVPEPSSVLGTLAFGAFGAGWMLKRKLRKQKLVSPVKSVD